MAPGPDGATFAEQSFVSLFSNTALRKNFTTILYADGQAFTATILPTLRPDGMHYEVNIPTLPRFYMRYGALDRYEVVGAVAGTIPDAVALAASDAIEEAERSWKH